MAYNFIECDRETAYLMPPSLREWLPQDDLAWFILDAVDAMDLSKLYLKYRADGWGRSAYDPKMMVSLILYGYSTGVLSSRQIERACRLNIAFRIITANCAPDYSTISRFRAENELELEQLFTQILQMCAKAGLVKVGVIAIDGTKIKASASLGANRTKSSLEAEVARIFREAKAKDAEEDVLYGPDKRGDELPEALRTREGRLERLKEAKARLEQEAAEAAAKQAAKIERYQAYKQATGKRLPGKPPKLVRDRDSRRDKDKANVTDPESRIMQNGSGRLQGYNAQIAVTKEQIIVGAYVTQSANDYNELHPMIAKVKEQLKASGIKQKVGKALADAGYCSLDNTTADPNGPEIFISTLKSHKQRTAMRKQVAPRGRTPKGLTSIALMARKLLTVRGRALYKLRSQTVEPVFGQIKSIRQGRHFLRRRLHAVTSEWSIFCSTHNLLKLWRSKKANFSRNFGQAAPAYA